MSSHLGEVDSTREGFPENLCWPSLAHGAGVDALAGSWEILPKALSVHSGSTPRGRPMARDCHAIVCASSRADGSLEHPPSTTPQEGHRPLRRLGSTAKGDLQLDGNKNRPAAS